MRNLFAVLLLPVVLCGFGPGDEKPEEKPQDPPPAEKNDKATDMTDMMLEHIKEALYVVTMHKDPKVGQYWESGSEAYGSTTTTRWQVAKLDGTTAIVEYQLKSVSEYVKYDYVLAYEVDLSKAAGEANVTKAWVGKPGAKGNKIDVMAKPKGATKADKPAEEKFTDLELAGGKWSGTVYTYKGDGWESKTWMAENGWFGGLIKSEAAGFVTELKKYGEDAKPLLKWDEEKDAKAPDGKEPEKKDEKKDVDKDGEKEDGSKDESK